MGATQEQLFAQSMQLHTEKAAIYETQNQLNEASRLANKKTADDAAAAAGEVVEEFVNNRGQTMGVGLGALVLNVASFFSSKSEAGYLHLKTPFKKEQANMIYLQFRGYGLYASSKIINDVASCYQYPNSNPNWVNVKGDHEPVFYIGSDGHVYCRLTIDNFYYLTVSVDSTRVGNGDLVPVGSCEFVKTDSDVEYL